MDFDEDPFPPSLPHIDGPRILDPSMAQVIEDNGLQYDSTFYNDPNFFSASYPTPKKSYGNHAIVNPADLALSTIQSPESLPDSSSSDSSNKRHKRTHSSNSSRSGLVVGDGDSQITDGPPAPNGILIGTSPVEPRGYDQFLSNADFERSNRAMECHFDFDSAASSPNPCTTTNPFSSSSLVTPTMKPLRAAPSHGFRNGVRQPPVRSLSSHETSPITLAMRSHGDRLQRAGNEQQSSLDSSGASATGTSGGGVYPAFGWPQNGFSGNAAPFNPKLAAGFHPQAAAMPFASPMSTSDLVPRPTLHVRPLPPKSRVETQIHIKLTLHPMPPGVSKLHLQPYTVSKSKLLAKPIPYKSSEMLELHATLVCTSAMQDPEKRKRAFARAAGPRPFTSNKGSRSTSSGSISSQDDDEKPANGGPVRICRVCIERERKRAGRKKTKNTEEDYLWLKDEARRSIVFNTSEIREWQPPSSPNNGDKNQNPVGLPETIFPEGALSVNLPTRIACYCRHQEEKVGFQIIFTLRDYQGNVVTQTITNSIIITDDHKTHPAPVSTHSQNGAFPDGVVITGGNVSLQPQTTNQGPALFRQAYSTTDLKSLQQQFTTHQRNPIVIPQNMPQTASATATPKMLSRSTSPSAPSGQMNKRRKASNSGKIRNDLIMTKLQTPSPPSNPNQGFVCAGQSTGCGSGEVFASAPNYVPSFGSSGPQMPSVYSQIDTNPAASSTMDNHPFSSTQRSQSMENLQGLQTMCSTTHSVHPSRAPSPTSGPQSSGFPQSHAQILAHSLHPVPGAVQPQRAPVIHKLTPAEGPKSGGIEVTCLGSGFCQGLEIMFGDAQATTTTFWGESALVCLVPPALQAGTVLVTFKHRYEQSAASPPNKLAVFKYIDDDEQMLMKHALALVNRKWNGSATDASDSARNIINFLGGNPSHSGNSKGGNSQQRYAPGQGAMMDLESAVLSCLNLVDLDDSPFQANFNSRNGSGQSMLHLSASLGYYRLTAGLLARGANPDIRDNNGMSPTHLASLRGHQRVIRKLRSAGADPTLRSLNGFTPADMASSEQAYDTSSAFDHHVRSRSAGATPASHLSRTSSVKSFKSSYKVYANSASNVLAPELGDYDSAEDRPITPARLYARSRSNSMVAKQKYLVGEQQTQLAPNVSLFAANPAMSALRDQLFAQIQQFQQTVHRTLPALQIPALPPIPTLPDYQAYPVVRRISSLVPQRTSRPSTSNGSSKLTKEADYHWWELLTGAAPSPPAYEEIYPENTQDLDDRKTPALRAAGEALLDQKCEAKFDHTEGASIMKSVDLGNSSLTKHQREQLRTAHAMKVKRLRSDRNLFFIWIPLLVLVLVAMLKDRAPQAFKAAYGAFKFARGHARGQGIDAR